MRSLPTLLALAALSACAALAPQQEVQLADPGAFAHAVRTGQVDASAYDFGAHGFWGMGAQQRAEWRVAEEAALLPPGARASSCAAEDLRGLDGDIWVFLAIDSADEASWRSDWAVLHGYRERAAAQLASVLAGGSDPHDEIMKYATARNTATDPRLRELFTRAIADQSALFVMTDMQNEYGISDRWKALRIGLAAPRLARSMCANADWLKGEIAAHGWFDAPTYGAAADEAAWLIAQHADRDLDFQRQVLTRLQALPAGATSGHNIAFLTDRLAVADHRPQRYGTQISCENGHETPRGGLDDPARVDARRAEAGLEPLGDYLAAMASSNHCR